MVELTVGVVLGVIVSLVVALVLVDQQVTPSPSPPAPMHVIVVETVPPLTA